jgi:hypothetical protein
MLTARRALAVTVIAVAMALVANVGPATARTGRPALAPSAPFCVTFAYPAERYANGIYSKGEVDCQAYVSISIRVCVQQYDPVFRYWYNDACKSASTSNNSTISATAIYPCAPSNYYGYRTYVHSSWSGGGTADVYSGSRNFACT